MALKDWKKQEDSVNDYRWYNKKTKEHVLIISSRLPSYSEYDVTVTTHGVKYKHKLSKAFKSKSKADFKTKLKALAYAKAYMRSH